MEIWVRTASVSDVSVIVALSSALFREDAGQRDYCVDQKWPEKEGHGYFADFLSRPGTLCLMAVGPAGKTFGYLAGYIKEGISLRPVKVAELESMYVKKPYRGHGVGERLTREFLSWAESRGAEKVSVAAYTSNERAIHFYEKLGFSLKSLTLET